MTININEQPNVRFFINYAAPKYVEWRLRLLSEWSNRPIEQDGIVYTLDLSLQTPVDERFSEFFITLPGSQLEEFDLQGWYKYCLEGSNDGVEWFEVETGTVKVINDSDEKLTEKPKYIGPNPDAEAYVIY